MLKSWMKNLPDFMPVCDINLPGTHNSCSKYVGFSFISRCQSMSIYEQLNIGIRFVDIRAAADKTNLYAIHGLAKCYKDKRKAVRLTVKEAVNACIDFLNENPSEAIIFSFKRDGGASCEDAFDLFYNTCIKGCEGYWYTENRIPELGEVRGKMVLLNRCGASLDNNEFTDDTTGLNFTGWPYMERVADTHKMCMPIPKRTENSSCEKAFIQDFYKMKPHPKWETAILPFLAEKAESKTVYINFFSGTTAGCFPKRYAKIVLKKFAEYKLQKNKKYGWIILDYPTEEIARKIAISNF